MKYADSAQKSNASCLRQTKTLALTGVFRPFHLGRRAQIRASFSITANSMPQIRPPAPVRQTRIRGTAHIGVPAIVGAPLRSPRPGDDCQFQAASECDDRFDDDSVTKIGINIAHDTLARATVRAHRDESWIPIRRVWLRLTKPPPRPELGATGATLR